MGALPEQSSTHFNVVIEPLHPGTRQPLSVAQLPLWTSGITRAIERDIYMGGR